MFLESDGFKFAVVFSPLLVTTSVRLVARKCKKGLACYLEQESVRRNRKGSDASSLQGGDSRKWAEVKRWDPRGLAVNAQRDNVAVSGPRPKKESLFDNIVSNSFLLLLVRHLLLEAMHLLLERVRGLRGRGALYG